MSVSPPNLQLLGVGLPKEVQQSLRSALSGQDSFNTDIAQALNVAREAQFPQYINGWVDFGAATKSQYWLLPFGMAHLSLTMRAGTIGQNAFVLPLVFAPTYDITAPAYTSQAGNEVAKLVIFGMQAATPGAVLPATGDNGNFAVELTWMVH